MRKTDCRVAVFLAAWTAAGCGGQAEFTAKPVKRGAVIVTVDATGTVKPRVEVTIQSQASGEIISFPLEEGDITTAGQVILRIDPTYERTRVNQAKADLISAEARLSKAKIVEKDAVRRRDRLRRVAEEKGLLAQAEMEAAESEAALAGADIRIAEANVIRAKESLKEARERLSDTKVAAPIAGVLLEKFVEAGQVITSGTAALGGGTKIATMADIAQLFIEADVDESDIGRIQKGQSAAVTADAFPGEEFGGVVTRIAPLGRMVSNVTVFTVILEIDPSASEKLRPNMTANVSFEVARADDVLRVPNQAVRERGRAFGVYCLQRGKPVWVPVTIGLDSGEWTEVKEGLSEGDRAVVRGLRSIMESEKGRRRRPSMGRMMMRHGGRR